MQEGKKGFFVDMILDKMTCPNCHSSNAHMRKVQKNKKHSSALHRGGYAAFGELSVGKQPNIVLHDDCRPNVYRNEVICDDCPCSFNCWTGNIDDGMKIDKTQMQIDKEKKDEESKIKLFNRQKQDKIDKKNKKGK